jgi:hypothetical protein
MKDLTKKCSLCNYYEPNGRTNGSCRLLDAPVQGNLPACRLAITTFKSDQCLVLKKTGQNDSYLRLYQQGNRIAYLPDQACQGEIIGTVTDYSSGEN